MPRVPTLSGPSVAPSLGPQNNFRPTLTPEAASLPGRQLQQQGQTLERAASNTGDMFLQAAEQANRVRAIEATNQAKSAAQRLMFDKDQGFINQKGSAAIYRKSGTVLPDEYGGLLDEEIAKIGEGLTNPQQRQLFQEQAANLSMSFRENAQRHFLTEFNNYQKSVHEGRISIASQTIALNAGDSKQVDEAINDIKASTFELGKQAGLSPEQVEIAALNATSGAHRDALMKALDEDQTAFAQKYFDKYKGQMTADDQRDLEKVLTEQNDLGMAQKAADAAVGGSAVGGVPMNPRSSDLAFDVAVYQESRGQQFDKSGKPLGSSAGAIGIAQVMEPTGPEAARLAGLPWDRQRWLTDKNYNYRIGKAYFDKQLRDFGSIEKAWAAYNGGPGALRAAIRAGGDNWLARMPKETRDYVAINSKRLADKEGSTPTQKYVTEQETIDRALEYQTATHGPPTPKLRALITQEASARWRREDQANKQREDENTTAALQAVAAAGGDVSRVAPSVLSRVPAAKLSLVTGFGKDLQNNVRAANPNLPVLYFDLTSNPAKLRDMDDSQFFALSGQMPDSDFRQLTHQRAELRNPSDSAGGKANVIDTAAVSRALNPQLEIMGISSSPAAKDKEGKARVGAIQLVVDRAILKRQAEVGRQLFDNEIGDLVDNLLARTYTTENTNMFGQRTGKTTTKPVVQMKVQDIPPTRLKRIEDNLKRRTGQKPTDEETIYQFLLEEIKLVPTR